MFYSTASANIKFGCNQKEINRCLPPPPPSNTVDATTVERDFIQQQIQRLTPAFTALDANELGEVMRLLRNAYYSQEIHHWASSYEETEPTYIDEACGMQNIQYAFHVFKGSQSSEHAIKSSEHAIMSASRDLYEKEVKQETRNAILDQLEVSAQAAIKARSVCR
jgi:hypothetical protein